MNFLCLISKFSLFKLEDLILRKISNDFNAEVEVGLTPGKDDKLKYAESPPFEAGSDD